MSNLELLKQLASYSDKQVADNLHQIIHLGVYINELQQRLPKIKPTDLDNFLVAEYRKTIKEYIGAEETHRGFTMFVLMRHLKRALEQHYDIKL